MAMRLHVNGREHEVDDRFASAPLLWVLRDVLGVHGVKFGCGAGFCAACTVLVDGKATKSCQLAAGKLADRPVVTAEAVAGPVADAVHDAWHRGNVVQCGYCQPGQVLAATSLLTVNADPDDAAIDQAMSGNLCRCGTYPRIRRAIHQAAVALRTNEDVAPLTAPLAPADPPRFAAGPAATDSVGEIELYLDIAEDGIVWVASSQVEMGQGIHTGLAAVVAEELDADITSIRVVNASGSTARYANLALGGLVQITAGSTSTAAIRMRYRQVAAKARARLVAAVAQRWGGPTAEVAVERGVLYHDSSDRQVTFAEVAAEAARLKAPMDVTLKSPADYRVVGRDDLLRIESPAKILGTARYTIDTDWPGILTAVVVHPPLFGARPVSVDITAASDLPGLVDILTLRHGVAVVAETFSDADRGARAVEATWDMEGAETRGTDELLDLHRQRAASGQGARRLPDHGDVDAAFAAAHQVVETTVELPYLAHVPMEPDNGACRRRDDGVVEVLAGSQSPDNVRFAVADLLGIPQDQVVVHVVDAGGGFGLRAAPHPSAVTEAVEIAGAMGWQHPIKVQWPRPEELQAGWFRPMAVVRARAALDEHGALTGWDQRIVAQSMAKDDPLLRDAQFAGGVDVLQVDGATDPPYAIAARRVEYADVDTRIPVRTLRSIGVFQNDLARETLVDEIAATLGQDPVEYRLPQLVPRARRVLEVAAQRADWGSRLAQDTALGVAVSNGMGTYSAQVMQVALDQQGRVLVERIVLVADPGMLITPDLARAQIEGGLLFGLSAALWGQITMDSGQIQQHSFDRYPIVRMRNTPDIEVHLEPSGGEPGGIGEIAVPSVAPALLNALAALTGERLRRLPVVEAFKLAPTFGRRGGPVPQFRRPRSPPMTDLQARPSQTTVQIRCTQDGPYAVAGDITLTDHDGRPVELPDDGTTVHLCRCGGSGNKPFCDGTHAIEGFDGTLAN